MTFRTSGLLYYLLLLLVGCSQRTTETVNQNNHLVEASSPYLQEHADNPVDWYEWGPDALRKAKAENKPLIISIGYASCHWCHVMEKETFMDTAVARIMNENFVSIKVDREERPDIDQVYVNAAQLISGSAGWPLNAFALPDGKPFYAATYFPRERWIKMLEQIIDLYKNEHTNVEKQANALTKGIQEYDLITKPSADSLDDDLLTYKATFKIWDYYIDFERGGLRGSPKFPMPVNWEFLLQYHYLTQNKKALDVVLTTLDEMARGGIYDHLGGGFARYSTDAEWKVPHFEKMLYDNGQLVSLYAHAYQQTENPLYEDVIRKTLEFIENEMTSDDGGFYSSINADSEGEEGKFYVWTKAEIENALDKKRSQMITDYYQITDSGNWEAGKNILHASMTKNEYARSHKIPPAECLKIFGESEKELFNIREKRVRPSRDEKILTAWNAIMLNGYLDAYFATANEKYLSVALKNAGFIEKNMLRNGNQLSRNYKDGKATIEAFLDDYALLAKAFIHLYEATYDIHWLELARSLTDYAIVHFQDKQSGMFYYTSDQSEKLAARKMEISDNVIPSSNSVMADVLFRLGEYFDHEAYTKISEAMLHYVAGKISSESLYHSNWALLLGMKTYVPFEVAVMGDIAPQQTVQLRKKYNPLAIFMGGSKENLPLLINKKVEGKTTVYVCRNRVCKQPVQDIQKALQLLKIEN